MVNPLPFGVGIYSITDSEWNAATTMDLIACREGTGQVSAEDIAMSASFGLVMQGEWTIVQSVQVEGCPGTLGTTVCTVIVPY
jgi:hypothetical protein